MEQRNGTLQRRSWLALLTVTLMLAGCTSSAPTVSPSRETASLPPTPAPTLWPPPSPTTTPIAVLVPATALPTSGPGLAISTVARAPADPAAANAAATSIDAFGLDLFRKLLADGTLKTDGNAVFSPTSIALALGMVRAGAKGETAAQMDAVLHTSGWDALGPGLNSLDQALASRDATWQDYEGEHALALRIANAAYGQQGWTIQAPYLDAIASAFGAGLHLADFATNPEAARKAINAWVNAHTGGKIPELLGPGAVDPSTLLVLVNAIYLKAEWEPWGALFSGRDTRPAPFTRLDGTRVAVPTMHTMSLGLGPLLPYASGNGWQATELRYQGVHGTTPLAMTLVLPDDLAAFEQRLTASQLARITGALATQREPTLVPCPDYPGGQCYPYRISLFLPRFDMRTRADLVPALTALGMPLAFSGAGADFSGIHTPGGPYISMVVHQADIDVNEQGTEAAAATALGATGGPGSGAAKTITLRFDHPFLFLLRDLDTGAVLFMGQVTDPLAGKGG